MEEDTDSDFETTTSSLALSTLSVIGESMDGLFSVSIMFSFTSSEATSTSSSSNSSTVSTNPLQH